MTRTFLLGLLCLFGFKVSAQLATEPSSQPTGLMKDGNDLTYSFDITFTPSGADGYLVLRSTEPINFTPVDGVEYEKGQGVGNAKVFSASVSSFIRIKEVVAATDYYFAVYAYNVNSGNPASINYLTSNPLLGTISSAGPAYWNYYGGIDWSSADLLKDLKDLINPHTIMSYDDFGRNMIPNIFERDTVGGQHVIECQYSGEIVVYSGSFNFSTANYNREHRMPVSWMDFNSIPRSDFELLPEGADYHALELVQEDVNSERLNYPFSNDLVSTSYVYIRFKRGKDSRNKSVAEVRNDRKGDVARALMYMMVAYNGKYSRNWGLDNLLSDAENQELQQLLDWHNQDPPDGFEMARNEYIYSIQGNRNPFIDYPDLVDCIDFTDVTLKSTCNFVGIGEPTKPMAAQVFPQPARQQVTLSFEAVAGEGSLHVYGVNGVVAKQKDLSLVNGTNNLQLDVSNYPAGVYMYVVVGNGYRLTGKLLVAGQ